MAFVRHTKRKPSNSPASRSPVATRKDAKTGRIGTSSSTQVKEQPAVTRYAIQGCFGASQTRKPPSTGPEMLANCQPVVFQATALGTSSSGTTCGSSDVRDGAVNARA